MFTLPELPYGYDALEPYIDTETMRLHHDKHHSGYVDNLNRALAGHDQLLDINIDELLGDLNRVPEDIRAKVKNAGGGHANHSLFWEVMSARRQKVPAKFSPFIEPLTQAAVEIFGSGWAWLVIHDKKLEIATTANQDSPLSLGHQPILGLDVWEHAYYLKYQNRRAQYIQNWWQVVNWDEVEKLLTKYV